jgi:hypothetical protein
MPAANRRRVISVAIGAFCGRCPQRLVKSRGHNEIMKSKRILVFLVSSMFYGCATDRPISQGQHSSSPQVTIPNGRSPATDNAPHAPLNDTNTMRQGWNHGNGVLWVFLRSQPYVADAVEKDGSLRIKFGWWRGVPGEFSIEGRRLDTPAPPLRTEFHPYAAFGFQPCYLYFPTEGFWEITGHLNDKSLTFVIHVIAETK